MSTKRIGSDGRGQKAEKHHMWKGNDAGIGSIHDYVHRRIERKDACEHCKEKVELELANKSQTYKRDLDDWLWLCRSCHAKYDNFAKNFDGHRPNKCNNCHRYKSKENSFPFCLKCVDHVKVYFNPEL